MKFSGKMILKKILKATKNQGFTPSLENTFLELRLESYTFWPKMSILGDLGSNISKTNLRFEVSAFEIGKLAKFC